MGQPVVAAAFWAGRNKPIWRASADPVGQPTRWPNQNSKFLNRFFIFHLDFQDKPPNYVAESIPIGRQWFKNNHGRMKSR
jgi:hypothetical protein